MSSVGARASFRSQLLIGSLLWTLGLLIAVSVLGVLFLAQNPRPHRMVLAWFITVPAGVSAAVGVGCMVAGGLRIRRSLSAMDQVGIRVAELQQGVGRRVAGSYPTEVQPLVNAVNALLDEREQRVARAVAKSGDLAHGLKTPLAVLAHDADRAAESGHAELADSLRAQIERMRRQIDYHLAHARATATGSARGERSVVAVSVSGLVRALDPLYAERGITVERSVPQAHVVRCPHEDLDEILGNLLDNACKWGRTHVRVTSAESDDSVSIAVDDDGPGLEPALAPTVLQRGVRADERVPGSGLGLAIARDLVEAYDGSIELTRSPLGGLRVLVRLPRGELQVKLSSER